MKPQTFLLSLLLLATATGCTAQIKNARTQVVHINGSCGTCEKRIEGAALVKGEATADWDRDSKLATITFDSTRTTADAVLKRVALAGYDNQNYLAPDAAYAALDGCCQYERTGKPGPVGVKADEHHHEADSAHDDHAQADTTPQWSISSDVQEPNEKTDQFLAVFGSYFLLKDALVLADNKAASARASELASALKTVHMERMGPELHGVWMKVMGPLAALSGAIASANDLDQQRTDFAALSTHMHDLVKVAPRTVPVYYDHCPMYKGGADWLSLEKPIKNPFYGSMMLGCGSVQETIP